MWYVLISYFKNYFETTVQMMCFCHVNMSDVSIEYVVEIWIMCSTKLSCWLQYFLNFFFQNWILIKCLPYFLKHVFTIYYAFLKSYRRLLWWLRWVWHWRVSGKYKVYKHLQVSFFCGHVYLSCLLKNWKLTCKYQLFIIKLIATLF